MSANNVRGASLPRVVVAPSAGSFARLAPEIQETNGDQPLARIVRALDQALRRDPVVVGEVYRVRGNVEEYLAVHDFLAIDFAIDKKRKLVLVRKCRALSSPGL